MPDIDQELQEITDLISLPEVYHKVRALMDDEHSGINDFAAVITIDPNLSARVLRVVNSAYFGLEEPVDSIPRALNMIGLQQLHNMVLGVSAISSLDLPNEILPLKPFWYSSLYTGVMTSMLADHLGLKHAERLFIAGLLHDIGSLVLCSRFPDHAREASKLAVQIGRPAHEIQHEMLDCHYGEIGARLLANWNMPSELQTLVRFQPTPLEANGLALETALLHLAHACTTVARTADVEHVVDARVRELIPIKTEQLCEYSDMARTVSGEMGKVILN